MRSPLHYTAFCTVAFIATASSGIAQQPRLIGVAEVASSASDRCESMKSLAADPTHSHFGGISALEYTGVGNQYLALPDRGPADGETGYLCRIGKLEISIVPDDESPVRVEVVQAIPLTDRDGRCFTGDPRQLAPSDQRAGRLDPEGIRLTSEGTFWVADEYGPSLIEFNAQGQAIRELALPGHLKVPHPSASKSDEIRLNQTGRISNRGLEGLAISPDGTTLLAVMQHILLQDGEREGDAAPNGRNCRMIQADIATGQIREYVYRTEHNHNGLHEILALSNSEFLVIEHDFQPGEKARFKKVMRINLAGATEVQSLDQLPTGDLPESIVPVQKREFLDLLNPVYGLAGPNLPEKFESLTFGPALPGGQRTLVIASDNDFAPEASTKFYAFAVELPGWETLQVNRD